MSTTKSKKDLFTLNDNPITLSGYTTHEEVFEEKKHIVVPITMMVPGVHCGSGGCLLYTEAELRNFAAAWNGIPIPIHHPKENGEYVSANSPEIIEQHSVGRLFNVRYDNGLKGEGWIDVEKAQQVYPEILQIIADRLPLEVSTGAFSDISGESGTFNGVAYDGIAENSRPDHLALLPDETGACSYARGCGVRANQEKLKLDTGLVKEIIASSISIKLNEASFQDIVSDIQTMMDARDIIFPDNYDMSTLHYVVAVFDDHFIYRKRSPQGNSFYKQAYSIDANKKIQLGEEAKEVREEVNYPAVNLKEEDKSMATNKKDACCPDKVDELIKNEQSTFTVDDKEFLLTLTAEQLDKVQPVIKEVPVDKEITDNEAKEALSDDDKSVLAYGKEQMQVKKNACIKDILANKKNTFTEAELETETLLQLERIASMARPADYSVSNANDIDVNVGGDSGDETEPLDANAHSEKKKEKGDTE